MLHDTTSSLSFNLTEVAPHHSFEEKYGHSCGIDFCSLCSCFMHTKTSFSNKIALLPIKKKKKEVVGLISEVPVSLSHVSWEGVLSLTSLKP